MEGGYNTGTHYPSGGREASQPRRGLVREPTLLPRRGWVSRLALLLIVGAGLPLNAADNAADDSPPWMDNVLQVLAYRDGKLVNQGSAVGLGNDGTILASAHIVAGADYLRLQTPQGLEANTEVTFVHEDWDLAVLRAEIDLPVLPLALREIHDKQSLTVAGYWHKHPEPERKSLFPNPARPSFVATAVSELQTVPAMASHADEGSTSIIAAFGRGAYGGLLINRCGELAGVIRPNPSLSRKQLWAPHRPVDSAALGPATLVQLPGGEQFARATEPCLTSTERLETEKSKAAESIAAEKERVRQAKEEANRAREAGQKERQARAEAESERANVSEIVSDVTAQLGEESNKRWEIEQRHQLLTQLAIAGGALALLVLVLLWLKRRRDVAKANYALVMATSSFADCRFRGQDANGAPLAFTVSGRDLMQRAGGLTLGRNPEEAAIVIADDTVSRQHAKLMVEDQQLCVEDLGSTGGTRVNGQPVGETRTVVTSGDVLEFGEVKVTLEVGE